MTVLVIIGLLHFTFHSCIRVRIAISFSFEEQCFSDFSPVFEGCYKMKHQRKTTFSVEVSFEAVKCNFTRSPSKRLRAQIPATACIRRATLV